VYGVTRSAGLLLHVADDDDDNDDDDDDDEKKGGKGEPDGVIVFH